MLSVLRYLSDVNLSIDILEQRYDLPYHGPKGLHRPLLAGHVSYGLGNGRAQAVRSVRQLVIFVARREELLQLFQGLVVRQPLALSETRP